MSKLIVEVVVKTVPGDERYGNNAASFSLAADSATAWTVYRNALVALTQPTPFVNEAS